jgi:hypothetical protein
VQAAAAAKAPLYSSHSTVIPLVIIAKQMQKAVQGEQPDLGLERMSGVERLAASHARRDHHIPQLSWLIRSKRQHIGHGALASVPAVQCPDTSIGQERNSERPSGAGGRH